jgi:hypothetical protein
MRARSQEGSVLLYATDAGTTHGPRAVQQPPSKRLEVAAPLYEKGVSRFDRRAVNECVRAQTSERFISGLGRASCRDGSCQADAEVDIAEIGVPFATKCNPRVRIIAETAAAAIDPLGT